MAFKLTKEETTQLKQFVADVKACVARQEEHADTVREAVEAYNNGLTDVGYAVSRLKDFAGEIAERLQNEWNEKSEKWQEGSKGESAQEMVDSWDSFVGELEEPTDIYLNEEFFPHEAVDIDTPMEDLIVEPNAVEE